MNGSIYIFGGYNSEFKVYPDDGNKTSLSRIASLRKAPSQLIIHRDANLMYYTYIREVEQKRYIGFSYVVNNIMIWDIRKIFLNFEEIFEGVATSGIFLHLNNNGNLIIKNLNAFSEEKEELHALSLEISRKFEHLNSSILPARDFTIEKDSIKYFDQNESNQTILDASHRYGFTVILKDKDFNTLRLNNYSATLSNLQRTNEQLNKEISSLKSKIAKISRQKKQFKILIFAFIIIIICAIGILLLNNNLTETRYKYNEATQTVANQNDTIGEQKGHINDLNNELSASIHALALKNDELNNLQYEYNQLKDHISLPFIYLPSDFDLSKNSLTMKYFGLRNETVKIRLTIWSSDIDGYYFSEARSTSVEIKKGYNSVRIEYPTNYGYLDEIVLSVNDKIIGGRHY